MKNKFCILLVDDSVSTNFYNEKLIIKRNVCDEIYKAIDGIEALDFIHKTGKFKGLNTPKPNIIFLDINMPKMDGFEFLENYAKLPIENRAEMIVVFLTTSNWTKDKVKAIDSGLVYDFIEKPLKTEDLIRINKYYQENHLNK